MRLVIAPLAALLAHGPPAWRAETTMRAPQTPRLSRGSPWVLVSGLDVEGWEETAPPARPSKEGLWEVRRAATGTPPAYTVDGDSLEIGQIADDSDGVPASGRCGRDGVRRGTRGRERGGTQRTARSCSSVRMAAELLLSYVPATPVGSWQVNGASTAATPSRACSPGRSSRHASVTTGELSGSAGCNRVHRLRTRVARARSRSHRRPRRGKACAEPAGVMEQEAAYLTVLSVCRDVTASTAVRSNF